MANRCMLCGKKIGLFSSYGEDIFTGNTANCICSECMEKTDIILKKSEMKIPLKAEDFERFSEEGRKYIDEYLEADSVYEEEVEVMDPMQHEIGEAVISHTFEVDDGESENVLKKLRTMESGEIEKFLDPLVSENDTADGFMNEIMLLNNSELDSVIADQREYYNNAEWAYILFVKEVRDSAKEGKRKSNKDDEPSKTEIAEEIPKNVDASEIERIKTLYKDKNKEELEEIINDPGFTYEAHKAAKELLDTK